MNMMKRAMFNQDWKSRKLAVLALDYEEKATAWAGEPIEDDRRVFVNTYCQIIEAVQSLPDNPHTIVCVAMNRYIDSLKKVMDDILARFA